METMLNIVVPLPNVLVIGIEFWVWGREEVEAAVERNKICMFLVDPLQTFVVCEVHAFPSLICGIVFPSVMY